MNKWVIYILGCLISLILLLVLLWPEPIQTTELGRTLANWLASLISTEHISKEVALVQLEIWLNFLMFIPFAFFLHLMVSKLGFWISPVVCLFLSLGAEFVQKTFLLERVASLQDVFLNFSGAIVGWVLAIWIIQLGKMRRISHSR